MSANARRLGWFALDCFVEGFARYAVLAVLLLVAYRAGWNAGASWAVLAAERAVAAAVGAP